MDINISKTYQQPNAQIEGICDFAERRWGRAYSEGDIQYLEAVVDGKKCTLVQKLKHTQTYIITQSEDPSQIGTLITSFNGEWHARRFTDLAVLASLRS